MRLDGLLNRIPDADISSVSLADPHCEVHNVSFLTTGDDNQLREDVLYFCDSELLPLHACDARLFNCIVVDGGPASDELSSHPNVNLVWLAPGANLFACYNAIQSAFLEDQELTNIVQRLLSAHFSNQGLQYLIEEAADALDNPIVVIDTTYHYIAYRLGNLEEDSTFGRVMRQEMTTETILEEAVSYIRDSRIDSEIAKSKGPLVQHNKILDLNTMTLAVMLHGVCVAHVMMMEYRHAFRALDGEAFVHLANFVGQELQKSEIWGPTSGERGSYFLENLLGDRSPSAAVTRRRLKALNFHPKPLLYVVCFHTPGEGLSQAQAEHVAGQLRPVLHHSLYTRYHQQLVALISRDEDEGLSERSVRKISEVAILNNLSVGISNAFRSIIETRVAYDQARAAIRYGSMTSRSPADSQPFFYRNYAYMQMLDLTGRRMGLINLCHPSLLSLMDYDEAHGAELMETLFCYLQTSGSTARSAKLLNLHKNTMLYRMGHIREVLGLDLTNGEDVFLLQVSFRALIYLGLFQPRLNISRDALSKD